MGLSAPRMTRTLTRDIALMVLAAAAAGCAGAPAAAPAGTPAARPAQVSVPERRHVEPDSRRQQECLALAMDWEARGEGRRGMEAVGWTVLNRVESPQFPSTPCAVVYQGGERPGCQFSWYCDGKSDRPRDQDSWRLALRTAGDLLAGPGSDPTGGALYFHAAGAGTSWHRTLRRTARVGGHVFYR